MLETLPLGTSRSQIAGWRRAVRALRPRDWWYFAILPLASLVAEPLGHAGAGVRVAGSVVVAALCLAYAFGINGIADRGLDRLESKNSLAGLDFAPREAVILVAACALFAAGIAAALSPVALVGAIVSLLAGTFYSANLRLKRLPLVGTLVNVLIFAPLPLLAVAGRPSPPVWLLTYCFWLLVTQNQILHEVADADEDAAANVFTTAVAAGASGRRWLAFALGPLGAVPLYWFSAPAASLVAAALGLCGGAAMVAGCTPARAAALRAGHRWYAFGVGVVLFVLAAVGGT